jgi:hypothetical protein
MHRCASAVTDANAGAAADDEAVHSELAGRILTAAAAVHPRLTRASHLAAAVSTKESPIIHRDGKPGSPLPTTVPMKVMLCAGLLLILGENKVGTKTHDQLRRLLQTATHGAGGAPEAMSASVWCTYAPALRSGKDVEPDREQMFLR